MNIYIKLGKNIKKYRLKNNLGLEDIEKKTNISKKDVDLLEKGKLKDIEVYKLIEIANVLNVDMITLLK